MKTLVRSYWVKPNPDEDNAPEQRIIHGKFFQFSVKQSRLQLGVQLGQGYFKCGSEYATDWIVDFDVYAWQNGHLECILSVRGLEKPEQSTVKWYELTAETSSIFVSVRRSGADNLWPCYNIANTGFILDGVIGEENAKRPIRNLHRVEGTLDTDFLSELGVNAYKTSTYVRYETPYYSVGFKLKSVGLQFFGCDGTGEGKVYDNLLDINLPKKSCQAIQNGVK